MYAVVTNNSEVAKNDLLRPVCSGQINRRRQPLCGWLGFALPRFTETDQETAAFQQTKMNRLHIVNINVAAKLSLRGSVDPRPIISRRDLK
jgi:hypothetical protein